LALPQKINLHNHIFRKALYSTSVRGPSDIWFWIYLLYPTPVCLEEPLHLYGYTVPMTLRPVIMYTSAKVGDIGPLPKGRHLRRWTKSGRLQSKGSHFWGFRLGTILSNEKYEGCPSFWSWGCHHQVPSYTNFSSLQLGAEASS
jgi:hypothetical protein